MLLPVGCRVPLGVGAADVCQRSVFAHSIPAYLFLGILNFLLEVLYLVVQGGHHCLEGSFFNFFTVGTYT